VYGLPTVLLFRDGEMLTGSKREGSRCARAGLTSD